MRHAPTPLAALFAASCLAGCGSSDHREQPSRAPAVKPAAEAPTPVATHDSAPAAVDTAAVPVMVGRDNGLDACRGLDQATTALEVRSGPGTRYPVRDHLVRDALVIYCGVSWDEEWTGVIYSPGTGEQDCGASSPIEAREPYTGPCRSGWVPTNSLKTVAG